MIANPSISRFVPHSNSQPRPADKEQPADPNYTELNRGQLIKIIQSLIHKTSNLISKLDEALHKADQFQKQSNYWKNKYFDFKLKCDSVATQPASKVIDALVTLEAQVENYQHQQSSRIHSILLKHQSNSLSPQKQFNPHSPSLMETQFRPYSTEKYPVKSNALYASYEHSEPPAHLNKTTSPNTKTPGLNLQGPINVPNAHMIGPKSINKFKFKDQQQNQSAAHPSTILWGKPQLKLYL